MEKADKVIFNSSPLINLAKADILDILFNLFEQIIIPEAVYNEVVLEGKNKEGTDKISELIEKNQITIKQVSNTPLVTALNKHLDLGEAEAITLTLDCKANLLVLDEKEARNYALIYDISITGFIGILIRAKNKGVINEVKHYLDLIISKGFYIKESLYNEILEVVDENY